MIFRITVLLLLFIMVLIKDLEMKVGTRRNDVGRVEVQLATALTSAPKRYHHHQQHHDDDKDENEDNHKIDEKSDNVENDGVVGLEGKI